ncbi:MAG: efflux RND transporter periplasmic adaptor subunit [Bacteroidota bacterium]
MKATGSLLLSVLLPFLLGGCQRNGEGIRPRVQTITEAVYGSVTVVPRRSYTVYPSAAGIVEVSHLEEGMTVRQNDLLLRVKSEQAELERKKAWLQYQQAKNNYAGEAAVLREMAERIAAATTKLRVDSSTSARQTRLWHQNIGSRQAYEMAQLNYATSRHQLRELRLAYARTQVELASQLELAETSLNQRSSARTDYAVRAELSGTVYEVFIEAGESVTPRTPLARIGSSDDFFMRLSIDEVEIARVEVGQEIVVVLDAYPGESFTAEVITVLPQKDERTQAYTAEAIFKRGPKRLFAGLSGEANIVVARRNDILTLPVAYVSPDGKILTNTGPREVVTGVTDYQRTEIVSGVDTNTIVYLVE